MIGLTWSALLGPLLLAVSWTRSLASTISNPLKPDGDISKVLPDYYDHKKTKSYHNSTPTRAVPVGAAEFGRVGDSSCSVKFRLRWAAEIESAVLSSPVIFPSGPNGKNEIFLNTFYQHVEILGFDGYKPFGWPISFEESSFHGSPMLYDIDGDGKNDIGMVDSDANMYWVRVGEFGQYLAEYHVQVPKLKIRRNWFEGMSEDVVDSYVALSMFDREVAEGSSETAKAKLDVLSVKSLKQASYPGLSSRGRRLMEDSSAEDRSNDDAARVGRLEGHERNQEEEDLAEEGEETLDGAFQAGDGGEEEEMVDDYMRRFRDHPNPFGDGGGSTYYHDFDQGSQAPAWEGGEEAAFYSAQRHRHYMDDMFAHSYYSAGMDMYNDTNFAFVDPHVLSTPVLTDVDGDGHVEVIMTISYYFDAEKYRGVDLGFDIENFVAGGIASWNLELQTWNWLVHLDLTTDKSRFKALIYSTPTVADIDGDGRSEIIFGTSLGLLYVLDGESGFVRRYFPMQFHEIQSQVAVADVVGNLDLEIIFGDMGGNVVCLNADGDVIWDAKVSGVVTQTPTIGDIDGDGDLDVVVTATYYTHDSMFHAPNFGDAPERTERGCHIWAFDGATGEVLPMFPMALPVGSVAIAPVVLVDLHDYSDINEKSTDVLLERDVVELLKVAQEDAEVMTEAQKEQAAADKKAAAKNAPKRSKTHKRHAKLHSVSDPAVPPWVQTSAGHEAPPSPSLQSTSSILGRESATGSKFRGGKSGGLHNIDEETIISSISKILSAEKQVNTDVDNTSGNDTGVTDKKNFISEMTETRRRIKEAELLKHIRYRADSGALGLHLIVAAGDGHIYIIDGAKGCAERIDIGEHVYSMPLVDDLSQDGFLDLVIGTVNGQVLALETEIPYHPLNVWSSFPKHRGNGFTHGVSGISIPAHEKKLLRYADTFHRHEGGAVSSDEGAEIESDEKGGNWLPITIDIWDARGGLFDPSVNRHYDVTFSAGLNRRDPILKKRFTSPGRYTVMIPVNPPDSFLLLIGMTNEHGQYFEDSVTISLCTQFYVWVKYIVCAPIMLFTLSLLFMKSSL